MYWLRQGPDPAPFFWAALFLLTWTGGWLLAAHVLRLRSRERLPAGLGIAVLLFVVLSSLWGYLLPVQAAFWAAGATILLAGLASVWRSGERPLFDPADLQAWPLLLALLALTALFALINRGLAIFDDYHNLPLVSTLAAGNLPPYYFLNTTEPLAYHYGLHLFSASLVRIGGLTPWSAYDLGKAFSLALACILAWSWFRQSTRSRWGSLLGTILALLGGGSRWLLLLLPASWLERLSQGVVLLGSAAQSGPSLAANLRGSWAMAGDGPVPFPFAFANGIFPPQVMALGSSSALPVATLFLILIIARRKWTLATGTLAGLILATLSMTAEHIFVLIWGGVFLAVVAGALKRSGRSGFWHWGWILVLSAGIALAAGGVITEIFRRQLVSLGGGLASTSSDFTGFGLRWPPGLISAHLGILSLADPGKLLIGLAEIGVVLVLGPWVTWWCWRRFRRGDWLIAGLGAAAVAGFAIPLFVRYLDFERDIVRLASAALFIWLVLGFPLAWFAARRGSPWLRIVFGIGYGITILGGLVLLSVQLRAIPRPLYSTFIKEPDAMMNRMFWNRLDPGAQVLDPIPHRAITILGLGGGRAQRDPYTPFAEWASLIADPNPSAIAKADYTYIYLDAKWWQAMSHEQQQRFLEPCVQVLAEEDYGENDFRKLLDIRACNAD
jgi:hypothetical protein